MPVTNRLVLALWKKAQHPLVTLAPASMVTPVIKTAPAPIQVLPTDVPDVAGTVLWNNAQKRLKL